MFKPDGNTFGWYASYQLATKCLCILLILNLICFFPVVDIDSADVELSITTDLNPSNAQLECDIRGRGLTYNWACNGCGATDTSPTLHLPKEGYTPVDGSKETITCTASVGSKYCLYIDKYIYWNLLYSNSSFIND